MVVLMVKWAIESGTVPAIHPCISYGGAKHHVKEGEPNE
jgi:hypothetical protein